MLKPSTPPQRKVHTGKMIIKLDTSLCAKTQKSLRNCFHNIQRNRALIRLWLPLYILAALLFVFLTGCGSQTTPVNKTEEQASEEAPFYENAQDYKELVGRISEKKQLLSLEADLDKQLVLSEECVQLETDLAAYKVHIELLKFYFNELKGKDVRLCLVKRLFNCGELRKADAVLSLDELQQEAEQLEVNAFLPGLQERKEYLAQAYFLKSLLWKTFYSSQLHAEQATQYFEEALHWAYQPQTLFEYSRLLYQQGQYTAAYAGAYYLYGTHLDASALHLSKILHLLFLCEFQLSMYEDAIKTWERAAGQYQKLAEEDSDNYILLFAKDFQKATHAQRELKNHIEEENLYKEKIKTLRALAQKKPLKYTPMLIAALQRMSFFQRLNEQPDLAKKTHAEALQLSRKGVEKNPETYKPALASTLKAMGDWTGEYKQRKKYYKEAVVLYRELAEEKPDDFLPPLAYLLQAWADELGDIEKLRKPVEAYESTKSEKAFFRRCKAGVRLCKHAGKKYLELRSAEKKYKEALKVWQQLARDVPCRYFYNLANTYSELAWVQRFIGKKDKAVTNYEEALTLQRVLLRHKKMHKSLLVDTLEELAEICIETEQLDKAENAYQEALQLCQKLSQEAPEDYTNYYLKLLLNLSLFYLDEHPNREKSVALAEQAMNMLPSIHLQSSVSKYYLQKAHELLQKNGVPLSKDAL